MDENFLIKIFSSYANVRNIKIIRDKITGMHQGYGFIEFESCEVASYVLDNCNGNLIPNSNRVFKLNWATFSEGKMNALMGNLSNAQEYTIYVCDLDLNVSEQMLREVFEKLYPSVSSSKLIIDPITKQSKGYGFVKFGDFNESQKAIMEMNGKFILNKPIKTNQAVWKKYNPETSKTYNNKTSEHKPYYQKYNKGNNNSYNNYQQQSYQYNNNDLYSHEEKEPPRQVYTQNINIYLQSLYQQHYLNNVYLNQYFGGNNCNSQDQYEEEGYNLKESFPESIQNFNEPYSKIDSSINPDGI